MALTRNGQYCYGDSQEDTRAELAAYACSIGYPATHFADAVCTCGHRQFRLFLDDNDGAAVRECAACMERHPIADSAEYLDEAALEECECPCGSAVFEVTVGIALYDAREDVRWIYIGCRCPGCRLTACYGDWKNEFEDYRKLLANV